MQVLVAGPDSRGRSPLGSMGHWRGLRQLVVGGIEQMADADLAPLPGFPQLHHLLLAGAGRIENGFAGLTRLPRFRELTLVDLSTSPGGEAAGAPGLDLPPPALRDLARAPALRTLDLINVQVERDALRELRNAPLLTRLHVTNLRGRDADSIVEPITSLPLRDISFEGCVHLTDQTLRRVAASRGASRPLAVLEVQRTQISDAGLRAVLDHVPNEAIRLIFLGGSRITARSLDPLASLPCLHSLDLRGLGIGDAGAAKLAPARSLHHLNLGHNPLTDACVESVSALSSLRTLDLEGTGLSPSGIAALEATLPDCEIVQGHREQLLAAARAAFVGPRASAP